MSQPIILEVLNQESPAVRGCTLLSQALNIFLKCNHVHLDYPTNIQKISKYYINNTIYFNLFYALINNINNNYYIKFAIYIFYIIFAFVEKREVDRGDEPRAQKY